MHVQIHTHTHKLTYIPWIKELERPSTESELNHNKKKHTVKCSSKNYEVIWSNQFLYTVYNR